MGGDNKLGMTIMLFMIKTPGTYYFSWGTNFKWWFMGSQNALMADPDFSKNLKALPSIENKWVLS
jgi:hypothetical protein